MKVLLVMAVGAAVIGAVVYLRSRSGAPLDLSPADGGSNKKPSIYSLIKAQLAENPDGALDYSKIHPKDDSSVQFAPGLSDALFGGGEPAPKLWKKVKKAIDAINAGQLSDWRALEKNLVGINASANVDALLRRLLVADVTPKVKNAFWAVAKGSADPEAVKWGIAVGSLSLTQAELEPLLTLARHSEFTLYCAHALLREAENDPSYKLRLMELLPASEQWGLIRLIDYIVADPALVKRQDIQQEILIYGTRNHGGIPMEVAFTIASAIDLPAFIEAARHNSEVYIAINDLMDTLLTEPAPLGGLADLKDWRRAYEDYVAMLLDQDPPEVRLLGALRSLISFLDDGSLDWAKRNSELLRLRAAFDEKFSADAVAAGLEDVATQWLSLQFIKERKLTELLPQVRERFLEKPDYCNIDTLGSIGEEDDFEALLAGIPRLVDLEARKDLPRSETNVFGPEHQNNFAYAEIVKHLGRLHTPESIVQIKRAAEDYDPQVRSGAYAAMASLPKTALDEDLTKLLINGMSDSPPYAAEAALSAAKAHSLATSEESIKH